MAGRRGSDDIHSSTPGCTVELSDIVPDWSGIKGGWLILESLLQDLLTVLVPFDIADCPGLDSGESKGEVEPARPAEEADAGAGR